MVDEVVRYGGDILKFAGDAFFAEWRVQTLVDGDDEAAASTAAASSSSTALPPPKERSLEDCVLAATLCASSMVARYSDFKVAAKSDQSVSFGVEQQGKFDAMLNVHCGVGVGTLVGLHVGYIPSNKHGITRAGSIHQHLHPSHHFHHNHHHHHHHHHHHNNNCKNNTNNNSNTNGTAANGVKQDEDAFRRREFLFLGDPIDQVALAADKATDGEVVASTEAIALLKETCDVTQQVSDAVEPERVAIKREAYYFPKRQENDKDHPLLALSEVGQLEQQQDEKHKKRQHRMNDDLTALCQDMDFRSLQQLHQQLSSYVHQVVRGEELNSSSRRGGDLQNHKAIDPYKILRDQAEIRPVYTMFIKAIISSKVCADDNGKNEQLYAKLQDIMNVTSRELRKYSGHLRQFIVDDKGVVIIGTFGLRGSTFANM